MTEKTQIKGTDIWITIDPHTVHSQGDDPKEYFTASYHAIDPATGPGGVLFLDKDKNALTFDSPVAALEYANEKLLDMIN